MTNKFVVLFLLLLFPIVLSGCWDYTEYENMAQITALGIDYDTISKETTLTLLYTSTAKGQQSSDIGKSSQASSTNNSIVHSAKAATLFEALQKLQEVIYKRAFFGYLKVIVIGEDAAKYNMADMIELHDRTPAIRTIANIVITSGKAETILSTIDYNVESTSNEIDGLIRLGTYTGAAFRTTFQDFEEMLAVGGLEATAPRIISTVQGMPEAKGGTDGNIKNDEEAEGNLRVDGMAAFKKDKFVGWLDTKESMGYGWITNKKNLPYKESQISGIANSDDVLYYRISKVRSKTKVTIDNGSPSVEIDIKVNADLRKYYSNMGSEFLSPEEISIIESKLADSINSDVAAALKKAQKEYKTDIFGFGFELFRKSPKLWQTKYEKKWDSMFPDIPVKVNVKAKVMNTGTNIKKFIIK